jgi:hypothetical protein
MFNNYCIFMTKNSIFLSFLLVIFFITLIEVFAIASIIVIIANFLIPAAFSIAIINTSIELMQDPIKLTKYILKKIILLSFFNVITYFAISETMTKYWSEYLTEENISYINSYYMVRTINIFFIYILVSLICAFTVYQYRNYKIKS